MEATPSQMLLINESNISESLAAVESTPLPHNTPVLICSLPGMDAYALSLGVAAYLLKPVSREQLLAALAPFAAKTVLIVDDDPDLLRLFRRMLADQPYRVLRAKNGSEALAIMAQQRPDVVLLDLVMPEMDGFQLLAHRNADPVLRQIPVIVVSSQDPSGQPIVSRSLAVTRRGGLSAHQLLGSIVGMAQIFSAQQGQLRVQGSEEIGVADGFTQERIRPQ